MRKALYLRGLLVFFKGSNLKGKALYNYHSLLASGQNSEFGSSIETGVTPLPSNSSLREGSRTDDAGSYAETLFLASYKEGVRLVLPRAFGVKPGFAQGGKFVVEREVGVFVRPLVEVLIGTPFLDAAGNQMGGPYAVALLPNHWVGAHGHVSVHEQPAGTERLKNALVQCTLALHLGHVMQGQGSCHGVTFREWSIEGTRT